MTGRHYNWHKRWRLDVESASAIHESGWKVRFTQPGSEPLPEIGGRCWTTDGREWLVLHVGGEDALNEWLTAQALRGLRDINSINKRIARLMREAGELWAYQKAQEH